MVIGSECLATKSKFSRSMGVIGFTLLTLFYGMYIEKAGIMQMSCLKGTISFLLSFTIYFSHVFMFLISESYLSRFELFLLFKTYKDCVLSEKLQTDLNVINSLFFLLLCLDVVIFLLHYLLR